MPCMSHVAFGSIWVSRSRLLAIVVGQEKLQAHKNGWLLLNRISPLLTINTL